jgi:hypothetical protein
MKSGNHFTPPWTDAEVEELIRLIEQRSDLTDIAVGMGRSVEDIVAKMALLAIALPGSDDPQAGMST